MVEGQRKCLHYLIMKTWISSWIASWVPGDIWTLLHNVQELFLCPASFTPPSKAVAQTEQEKHPHLTERTQVARGGKRLAQGPCVDHLPFALLFVYLPTLFPQRIWRYIMKYKIAINIMFSQDKGKYTLENLSFLSWYRPSPFPPPGLSRGCDLCQEHLSHTFPDCVPPTLRSWVQLLNNSVVFCLIGYKVHDIRDYLSLGSPKADPKDRELFCRCCLGALVGNSQWKVGLQAVTSAGS